MGTFETLIVNDVSGRFPQEAYKLKVLIIDTSALIHHSLPVMKWAAENPSARLLTIPQVFQELKDKVSRETMNFMTLTGGKNIETVVPDDASLRVVIEEAKRSGDLSSLSIVDLKLIALTLMMQLKEENGSTTQTACPSLRATSPLETITLKPPEEPRTTQRQTSRKETLQMDSNNSSLVSLVENLNLEDFVDQKHLSNTPSISLNDNDNDGWITPFNIKSIAQHKVVTDPLETLKSGTNSVACMTSDFAMQNMLLRLNLPLLSFDGQVIKRIQNWVLRCHACFKSTKDMNKKFCPTCGNHTLIKTSVTVDENGHTKFHLKKDFQYRLRGTIYPIPKPQGGRKSQNLVLCEDQKEFQRALKSKSKEKLLFDLDNISTSFSTNEPNKVPDLVIGYGKRNPNDVKKYTGRRKK